MGAEESKQFLLTDEEKAAKFQEGRDKFDQKVATVKAAALEAQKEQSRRDHAKQDRLAANEASRIATEQNASKEIADAEVASERGAIAYAQKELAVVEAGTMPLKQKTTHKQGDSPAEDASKQTSSSGLEVSNQDPLASWHPRKESEKGAAGLSKDQFEPLAQSEKNSLFISDSEQEQVKSPDEARTKSKKQLVIDTSGKSPRADKSRKLDKSLKRAAAPTPATAYMDDRRRSLACLPRIPKRPRNSVSSVGSTQSPNSASLTTVNYEPEWYQHEPLVAVRDPRFSDADSILIVLKTSISKAKEKKRNNEEEALKRIRDALHKIAFLTVDRKLLRARRMLDNSDGLQQLFVQEHFTSMNWPFDIQADARELYNKWYREDFDVNIMRGIQCGQPKAGKETIDRSADKIKPGYQTRSAKVTGSNGLVNGQWWPTQLTALRDGAHGSSQGGIFGEVGKGAYSCIMSGGHGYPDEDYGNWVWYCGTEGKDGDDSGFTRRMMESVLSGKPVRLIRSQNLPGEWAPAKGFRYDGLYDVVEQREVSVEKKRIVPEQGETIQDTKKLAQFKLVRQPGQDPIRGGKQLDEKAKRPTQQEIEAHERDRRNRGFGV